MKYYIVLTKCGHLGRDRFMPISFTIKAENAKEAASIARMLPRVKHHHKDAIISVREVCWFEYKAQAIANEFDPYLNVKSRYEQAGIMFLIEDRIQKEEKYNKIIKKTRRESVEYKRTRDSLRFNEMKMQIAQYC